MNLKCLRLSVRSHLANQNNIPKSDLEFWVRWSSLNNEEKGYTIKDKRFSAISEEEKRQDSDTKNYKKEDDSSSKNKDIPLPEINFATFILSLTSSAMLHFGDIADPVSGKKERNLTIAKQTIDMIDMLREKTKGNLTKDEEALVENTLYELKIRYVKESSKGM